MTTERARRTTDPAPPATAGQRLHRRATDRVIGGVAGGIADYLNIDPLLVRAAFVGLMIFGAAGLFIYLAVWLLVPVEGSDESVLEAVLSRVGLRGASTSRLGWLALGVVAAIFFIQLQSYPYGYYPFFVDPRFVLALIVIVGGIMFMRRNSTRAAAGGAAAGAVAPVAAAEPLPARAARVRKPRERSPLALYTIGALLVVFGLVAAVDGLTDTRIVPGVYVGAVLATVGVGLVVGAWWGRARWLIAIGILLIPIAIVASFITAPLEGGWGEHFAAPSSVDEIQGEYRLAGGRLTLDLRDLPRSAADREISASVGIGQLVVIVPELAGVDVTARVGAGTTWLLSDSQGPGTELEIHRTAGGSAGTYTLNLEVGMGEVSVERMDGSPR